MILISLLGVTLEGTITNPEGLPVAGAQLGIYDRRFRLTPDPVVTDADGFYQVELPDGRYRIRVLPPRLTTGSEVWFGDTLRACDSPRHDPAEQGVVDIQLPAGSAIEGSVFFPDRRPATGELEVYPEWQPDVGVATRRADVDEEGHFLVTGLPPDVLETGFLLRFNLEDAGEVYHPGAYFEDDASRIEVDPGGLVQLPAFSLPEVSTVRGLVLGPDGPVQGASVIGSSVEASLGVTGADGTFVLEGLPRLPTTIQASATGLARTYLGDTGAAMAVLRIDPDEPEVDGVVLNLPRAGRVQGTVPQIVPPETGGLILARADRGQLLTTTIAEDGSFAFDGVFPGPYTLESWTNEAAGFVSGRLQVLGASQFEVVAGETLDVGALELSPAARLFGTALDDRGSPIGGAAIIIEDLELGRRVTFTDDEGAFEMVGITPGFYELQAGHGTFCAVDPTYVSVFWPQQVNPQVRRKVELKAGESFEWDTVMPVDEDGDDLGDLWEEQYGLDTTIDDSGEDPDGDGFTNLAEYRLGTDPTEVFKAKGCNCATADVGSWLGPSWLKRR